MVEGEFVHVVDAVWIDAYKVWPFGRSCLAELLQGDLNALCQVEREREVERAILLECFKHLDELFVIIWAVR